ncbi:methyltransferase family protein [Winogradskyella flava]|uniref:Isoprenylcysteine carboxylmethyltransferase family protein n=1 Tax=Winogradskyella flava TaxID=1884876 RepID=A0A842IXD0_9FLAO|nr:isoprenylcysteine carboxylmethyltransferase family protein [Winogradskyella flava]MBC2845438.1 isoprenylcysteine carboxylmethyltransferase family protein [Winogradskyella flava]
MSDLVRYSVTFCLFLITMLSLYIKNLFFFILQPGLVVGLIPYMLIRYQLRSILNTDFNVLSYLGLVIMISGLAIALYCVYRFIVDGRGTLSPAHRTKTLVVKGLYKYSRNPMYVGMLLVLIGEVIFTGSMRLLVYTILVGVAFHLFVIFVEEPRLTRDFKADYLEYMNTVNRWF